MPTFLAYEDIGNEKGARLQLKVVQCVEKKLEANKVFYVDNEGVARVDFAAGRALRVVLSIPN